MEGGEIIRIIGGESVKKIKEFIFLTSTKENLTFNSSSKVIMEGKEQGVTYSDQYIPPLPLRVLKLDGPFNDKGEKVSLLEKDEWYIYKVLEFNRNPKSYELKKLKWATQYDGKELIKNYPAVVGEREVSFRINENQELSQFRVYAYFEKPIIEVSILCYLIRKEVIIIVGTEQNSPSYGNKLMFPAQALREIRENYINNKHVNILIFKDGYTPMQLSIIKRDIKQFNKTVYFKEINSVDELIDYINKGDATINRENTKIETIKIFSHGLPSILDFGLNGENEENQRFKIEHINRLKKESFSKNPVIYSYACRTGNSDFKERYTEDKFKKDVKPEESLAQRLAEYLDAKVYAFLIRTNYTATWNDGGDKEYQSKYITIEAEDASNPLNPRDWYRAWKTKWDEALWNSTGAFSSPTSGNTPKGLPREMFIFEKGKKPLKI